MKSNAQNIIEISESKLIKNFYQVKPNKNETYKDGDMVEIDRKDDIVICAKISPASSLIRKHLDVSLTPPTYRKE